MSDNEILNKIILKDEERQPCECWTRVMGYFRPTSEFNIGKKQEFKERKYFDVISPLKLKGENSAA